MNHNPHRQRRGSSRVPPQTTPSRPKAAGILSPRLARLAGSPFLGSLASGLLLWAALPPLHWSFLAWIAPVFWLALIRAEHLPTRRPYLAIWAAAVLFWCLTMQGIRLAHWANYFGLLAMSCVLGIYLPLFIAISRQAVHRWHMPLWLAAPLAWTGLELVRGYGPLGFSMALLAHTQAAQLRLIQISDLCGTYAVSFVIMLVASCLFTTFWQRNHARGYASLIPALLVLTATLLYGQFRLHQEPPAAEDSPPVRVALIQGSIDTRFDDNPNRSQEMLDQYSQLTAEACERFGELDLIVWPETMFPIDDIVYCQDSRLQLPPHLTKDQLQYGRDNFQRMLRNGQRRMNPPVTHTRHLERPTYWLLGVATWKFGDHSPQRFNTAMLVAPDGSIQGRYHKMHPVLFGEYVPFGDVFPWLYQLTPMPNGLSRGRHPVALEFANLTAAPSICFESTIPHLIRGHFAQLARQGKTPDLLINLTNDGWFWGSSILDLQLICATYRAVELRRPMLVAANTGLSAFIDGNGRVRTVGPRRATATLLAEVQPDGRTSGYQLWGDLPVALCGLFCLFMLIASWSQVVGTRIRHRKLLSA